MLIEQHITKATEISRLLPLLQERQQTALHLWMGCVAAVHQFNAVCHLLGFSKEADGFPTQVVGVYLRPNGPVGYKGTYLADNEDALHVSLPRYDITSDEALSNAAANLETAERVAAEAVRGQLPDPAMLDTATAALAVWSSYAKSALDVHKHATSRSSRA